MLQELAPELEDCEPGALRAERLPHLQIIIRMGEARSPGMFNFPDICELGGAAEVARLARIAESLKPSDPINIQFR